MKALYDLRRTFMTVALAAASALPSSALAQGIPTVNPDGTLANPEAPPPQAAPPPQRPIVIRPGADGRPEQVTLGDESAEPQRYYYTDPDTGIERSTQQWDMGQHGPVPEHHVIRRGDTLWEISWIYFNDPWQWPKVWSYNPSVTNPHWIYPGDLVRLYPKGEAPVVIAPVDPDDPVDVASPVRNTVYGVDLRQLAFVDREKLAFSGRIVGSVEEKVMLTSGDQVYVEYPSGKPPEVGKRYAIYTEKTPVNHPDGKKGKVGSYVRILGELRIESVKKDMRARAVIEDVNDVVERGHLVGPIQRSYRGDDIAPTAASRDQLGTVLAMLKHDQLIGEGEVVFIDLGKEEGLARGNVLHVVRRGDANAAAKVGPRRNVGQNDEKYPSRSIGRIIVVDVGKHASVALVVDSDQEFEVGDRVILRKAQ